MRARPELLRPTVDPPHSAVAAVVKRVVAQTVRVAVGNVGRAHLHVGGMYTSRTVVVASESTIAAIGESAVRLVSAEATTD